MVESARSTYRRKIRSVEAEEVNARFAVIGHVCPDIELWKARESRQRRKSAAANATHPERYYSDPASSVESVEGQLRRNQRPHVFPRNWPVSKEQIVPGLLHDPRTRGKRPRAMRGGSEQRMHARSVDLRLALSFA